ncbi:MAG: hypothetical protein ABIJ09_03365 [Pseudomonadota bacterium]
MSTIQRGSSTTGTVPAAGAEGSSSKPEAPESKARDAEASVDKAAPERGLASPSVQAGQGDVMVTTRRAKDEDGDAGAKVEGEGEGEGDGGGDGDGDDSLPGTGGGFIKRMLGRTTRRRGKSAASADGAGDAGDTPDKQKSGGKGEGGGRGGRVGEARSRGRSERGDRADAKKGSAKAGMGRARPVEGRERTEDVEQVSVLVGQDEGGGDPVEQALAAKKRIIGEDEHKNAFTSTYHDDFDPTLEPPDIERLGSIQGAIHMVRLADHMEDDGLDRDAIIDKAVRKLLGFARPDQVKKMLGEMNTAPIKQVYPLEVMLRILDEKPDFWPKVSRGEVLLNRDALATGERVMAGHEFRVKYPADYKIKAFALLGGEHPGYEFAPYKNGMYRMVVDEPGTWTFALSAERKGMTVVDTFSVTVHEPGKLGAAPTAEDLDAEDA